MKKVIVLLTATLLLAGAVKAMPVAGTFDSRTEGSTIIANVPWEEGASVSSFWEDCTDFLGMFTAYGYTSETQWYIEAQDPDWNGGWMGYIQLNSFGNAPWFGDDPAVVGGYEGQITGWTLDKTYTGDVLDLVLRGTAVLDKKHLMPWYDFKYEDMSPVSISFEMGFNGVPDEGYIGGTPDYLVVSVPEPTTMALLGLGAVSLLRRKQA